MYSKAELIYCFYLLLLVSGIVLENPSEVTNTYLYVTIVIIQTTLISFLLYKLLKKSSLLTGRFFNILLPFFHTILFILYFWQILAYCLPLFNSKFGYWTIIRIHEEAGKVILEEEKNSLGENQHRNRELIFQKEGFFIISLPYNNLKEVPSRYIK